MKNTIKLGFTLAEILITLAIIAVIAVITLPSLVSKTNKAENVVALKKAYATLSQVFYRITADNGGIQNILNGATTNEDFANVFIPKLNVAKNCGTFASKSTLCFANEMHTLLNGNNWQNLGNDGASTILTSDGMSYRFGLSDANCAQDWSLAGNASSPFYNSGCGFIGVDINGPNKGPARMGRDIFFFMVTKKGVYPEGALPDKWPADDCSTNGWNCAGKVLFEGAINY